MASRAPLLFPEITEWIYGAAEVGGPAPWDEHGMGYGSGLYDTRTRVSVYSHNKQTFLAFLEIYSD